MRKTPVRRAAVRRPPAKPLAVSPLLAAIPPLPSYLLPAFPPTEPPPRAASQCPRCADALLSVAYQQLGKRYVRGGSNPQIGFDCSGLTRYVYQSTFPVSLPSSAPAQFNIGLKVERDELQPGDLVFFNNRRRGWHVGLYVGDGAFLHAPNRRRPVSVSPLFTDPYWRANYVGARRILLTEPADLVASSN
ncbi:MAG: C40 family peptidase [Candidatus Solibacter usitatus]|nr:C40 family peptidase [Candidatus Solibacter usitatus]